MKQQKQAPSTMKVEIGGVEYTYELKEKEEEVKCQFEVGDVFEFAGCNDALRLFEGVDEYGRIMRRGLYDKTIDMFELSEEIVIGDSVNSYVKSTPEQERLFKQKCLESGFWFDKENKKWIQLKEGGLYKCDVVGTKAVFIFDRVSCCGIFSKASIFKSGSVFFGDENCVHNNLEEFDNISEATEEEKQSLFDALAKKGKQWNVEKSQIEDFMWVPKEFDRYVYYDAVKDKVSSKQNINTSFDRHMVNIGNCFKTESECEKYAKYMKKCSKNYKQLKEKLL